MSEIPQWKEENIGNKLKLLSGFPFFSSRFSTEEGVPLIRIRDVLDSKIETYYTGSYLPMYVIRQGDILIGMDGDFHISKWNNQDALLNQRVLKIEVLDSNEMDLEFVFYWLQPFIKKVNDITAATTVKHLSVKDVKKAKGKIPKKPVQTKIGVILSNIDRAIESTQALIEKYQLIKAGLMHDLFTRGIGADGKLRPPREAAPELYQETAIGWIPKEWTVENFGTCVEVIDPNPSHRYPPETENGYPICSTENFAGEDGFDFEKSKLVPDWVFKSQNNRCRFKATDVVFARKGKIGLARRYGYEEKVFSHTVVTMKPLSNSLDANWLLWLCRSAWLLMGIEVKMNTNSGVPTLGVEFIKTISVPFPLVAEQQLINQHLEVISKKIQTVTDELEKLRMQKVGLMHDLLTGKVKVKVEEAQAVDGL